MKKTIISLFDYTGNWSLPWKVAGYNVVQVDIKNGINILEWDYKNEVKGEVVGILAAVPCTDYAVSGARWFKDKDKDGRTEQSQKLVDKTREIIEHYNPKWWVIENPVSRIEKLNPWIGRVKHYFHPYEYAGWSINPEEEQYSKKTGLWGNFITPEKKKLECLDTKRIHQPQREDGSYIGWNTEECKTARQITPRGFSLAFYEANKDDNNLKWDIVDGEKQYKLFLGGYMTNKEIGLDAAILKQMVEKDGHLLKCMKYSEELTELRFSLQTDDLENRCLEISQVLFIQRQLLAYDKQLDFQHLLINMLDKYSLSNTFWWQFQECDYWKDRIKDQIKIEYDKYRVKKGL